MANGVVRIALEVAGLRTLRNALRGVVSATNTANRDSVASGRAADRLRAQSTVAAERMRVQAIRNTSAELTSSARVQARSMREMLRTARRGISAASAIGAVAVNRSTSYASELGLPDRGSMVRNFMSNQQSLIRLANQAGRRGDIGAIGNRVGQVAQNTMTDPSRLIDALNTAQNRFSDFGFVYDNLEELARASTATGADIEDMVGAVGEFRRQMGVTADEVPELTAAMVEAARSGSIEVADLASSFAPMIGAFQRLTGREGMDNARDFLGTSQTLGAAGRTPEQAATLMQNLIARLSDTRVQSRLERTLGDQNLFDAKGSMQVSMADLMGRVASRDLSASQMRRIFGPDMQVNEAVGVLSKTIRHGRENGVDNEISRIAGSSAAAGAELVNNTMTDLTSSTSGQVITRGIQSEVAFAAQGDATVGTMLSIANATQGINERFPLLRDAIGDATSAFRALTEALGADSLAYGGAGSAVGSAAGSAVGGGAVAGTAGAAAGGGLAAMVGGGLLAGAGGFLLGSWINENTGIADELERAVSAATGNRSANEILNEPSIIRARQRRSVASGDGSFSFGSGTGTINLSPESAAAMGHAVGKALANPAPGSGRTPGEPGRRS